VNHILSALSESAIPLTLEIVTSLRDRAASLVLDEPGRAHALSGALLDAVTRRDDALDPATLATAWRSRGETSLFTGHYAESQDAYARATDYADQVDDPRLLGQILVAYIHVLSVMGKPAEASRLARRAERLLKKAEDHIYLGKLHMNRGNVLYQSDEYQRAYNAYRKAEQALSRAGIRDITWASLLVNQAIACTNLSQVERARELFLRVEQHAARENLAALAANAWYNRSFLEAMRGDYQEALSLLERAREVFENQGVIDLLAATQRSRAEMFLDLGMPREAAALAEQAAAAFASEGMPLDEMIARVLQARSLGLLGRQGRAEELLEAAAGFFAKQKNRARYAASMLSLAEVHRARGRYRQASQVARRAERAFSTLDLTYLQHRAARQLCRIYLAWSKPSRAAAALEPIRAAHRRLSVGERLDLYTLQGRIARARGDRAAARRNLRRAAHHLELQRQLVPGTEFRSNLFREHVGVYQDLIALEWDTARPRCAEIFKLMEAARARGFRDRMRRASPRAGSALNTRRAYLGSLLRRLTEITFPEEGAPDAEAIAELIRDIRHVERDVVDQIHRRQATERGSLAWSEPTELNEIARLLRPDEALLEYFLADDRILAITLTRSDSSCRALDCSPAEIQGLIERIRFAQDAVALSPVHPASNLDFLRGGAEAILIQLHAHLIKPLEADLAGKSRWVVVPHRLLHHVPFECLHDGSDYIDRRLIISRSPTAEMFRRRRRRRKVRGVEVLVCGARHPGLESIPIELGRVAEAFPRRGTRVIEDATTEDLLAHLPEARIVHISTHAVFREDNPLFSHLRTRDGALFLSQLTERRLSAELVALSACNTGSAFSGHGDDLAGVAHGFLAGGARILLASLWRVHDGATADLMQAFYHHYTNDPAAALSRAMADVRRQWNHPFYWGAFSIHGV